MNRGVESEKGEDTHETNVVLILKLPSGNLLHSY